MAKAIWTGSNLPVGLGHGEYGRVGPVHGMPLPEMLHLGHNVGRAEFYLGHLVQGEPLSISW